VVEVVVIVILNLEDQVLVVVIINQVLQVQLIKDLMEEMEH
jgi:hypothetical protein